MWELACRLPARRRPSSILYVASGIHLAPLVLCEALPAGTPCRLDLTETDPSAAGPIGDLLADLQGTGVVKDLVAVGRQEWRFVLSGHPVRLRFELAGDEGGRDPPLITPGILADHDLVVSHDWAGDPVGNLRVILWHLRAARHLTSQLAPMLMIEDLEAHPFPVDLQIFGVLARTSRPYGHRVAGGTVGRHGAIEAGTPLFGGAVVLGFDDEWWRKVPEDDLGSVLDLLIFSRFGWFRRNVLVPGNPPLAAPEALDWWSGYGARTVEGELEPLSAQLVERMVEAAVRAGGKMSPPTREALCREVRALSTTLERMARGARPSMVPLGRVEPRQLPSAARNQLREAEDHAAEWEAERRGLRRRARGALGVFQRPAVERFLRDCRETETGR